MKKKQKFQKRKLSSPPSKQYFTPVHEQAILDFVAEEDPKERERLYVEIIQPAFHEMVEKIVFTYRFISLPNVEILKQECQTDLVTILSKYKQRKGTAFSYFSVVTKNWFNHKRKKIQNKAEVNLEESQKTNCTKDLHEYADAERFVEDQEFWTFLRDEVETWDSDEYKITENEKKVIDAIKTLMDNVDDLEIITRKSIYLYLREITGLPTKKIVAALTHLRKKYFFFRRRWLNEIF